MESTVHLNDTRALCIEYIIYTYRVTRPGLEYLACECNCSGCSSSRTEHGDWAKEAFLGDATLQGLKADRKVPKGNFSYKLGIEFHKILDMLNFYRSHCDFIYTDPIHKWEQSCFKIFQIFQTLTPRAWWLS